MKKIIFLISVLFFSVGITAQSIQPYFSVGAFENGLDDQAAIINKAVTGGGFEVIGSYHPADDPDLFVMCFTNDELRNLSLKFKDRGALGSVLRAAIVHKNGKSKVSFLNPEYMFIAYWGEQLNGQENQLAAISDKVKNIFMTMGTLTPFGGEVDKEDLPEYHYKIMMPYFTDPDELETFDSFEEGLATIRKNLAARKGNTLKVYEQVFEKEKIAVFGVGLLDKEDGEAYFLPVIGEENIAAMPYEIILQGKEATALAGKYRFALYWPELSMSTFMKIVTTPGYVEDVLESLCEDDD
jgi:hypothetical protein